MKIKQLFAAACFIGGLCAGAVHAAVVDFEDVFQLECTTDPITSGGYAFAGLSGNSHCVAAPEDNAPNANNGTSFLVEGNDFMVVTNALGEVFTVLSIDLGTSYDTLTPVNSVTVTGARAGGGTVAQTFTITDQFQTFALNGFVDVESLFFEGPLEPNPDGSFGYYALDNLVVTVGDEPPADVPLPATLPLLLLGLGALAASRRRS